MSSDRNMLVGFMSYAHADNEHDKHAIHRIAKWIAGEVRAQTGSLFDIFIDSEDIRTGEKWKEVIDNKIKSSICLIAVMTPSYFNSEHCKNEYTLFKKREEELKRNDLIIPFYYITVDEIRYKKKSTRNFWLKDLANRQFLDWRQYRFQGRETKRSLELIRDLAQRIQELIIELDTTQNIVTLDEYEYVSLAPPPDSKKFENYIASVFSKLSTTQKNIMQLLYNYHNDEITIDDLFDLCREKYGKNTIVTDAELYYRIKDLVAKGLLLIQPLGYKTTLVISRPEVATVLSRRNLLRPT